MLPGPDRPDYFLGHCQPAINWFDDGTPKEIQYLVLCARYVGAKIEPRVSRLAVGIAFVTDESILDDEQLELSKVRYSAIGLVTDTGNQE